jgi:chromosome partitioning protein
MGSGIDKRKLELTVYRRAPRIALSGRGAGDERACGYDVLGANRELAGAEVELVDLERREKRLREALTSGPRRVRLILIDCAVSVVAETLTGCAAPRGHRPMQMRVLRTGAHRW